MSIMTFPKPTVMAAATLREEARLSVQRSQHKLPILAARAPDCALLIERHIDAYMPPSPDGGIDRDADGEHLAVRPFRHRSRMRTVRKLQP